MKIISIINLLILSGCAENENSKVDITKEKQNVIAFLNQYKAAVEKLDTTGTAKLFLSASKIFESGSYEGNYKNMKLNISSLSSLNF